MNNFELHEKAQQLADTTSAYELARQLIQIEESRDQLSGCFHSACEELTALKAALVDEGEEAPVGPALSLLEKLKAERDALFAHADRLHGALLSGGSDEVALCRARAIAVDESPATSLACRDAIVAAQTARQIQWNVAGECVGFTTLQPHNVLGWLSDYAEEYGRQAEQRQSKDALDGC